MAPLAFWTTRQNKFSGNGRMTSDRELTQPEKPDITHENMLWTIACLSWAVTLTSLITVVTTTTLMNQEGTMAFVKSELRRRLGYHFMDLEPSPGAPYLTLLKERWHGWPRTFTERSVLQIIMSFLENWKCYTCPTKLFHAPKGHMLHLHAFIPWNVAWNCWHARNVPQGPKIPSNAQST